jgi:tetratricopeptide (TPR) repeat protein
MVDGDRRKAHHDATKVLLEDLKQDNSRTALLGSAAHHFARAGMIEEAREYSMLAALDALEDNEQKEGTKFLGEAMEHLKALGPNKKQPGRECVGPLSLLHNECLTRASLAHRFCSQLHETLFCLVNLGRLKEAEEFVRAEQGSALTKCIPRSVVLHKRMGQLKSGAPVHPSIKIVTRSEAAYLELQGRMWAEILKQKKGEINDTEFFELTLQQLDAGLKRGNAVSFLVSLVAVARYFTARGDLDRANHYLATTEHRMPEEPALLVEGWLQFGRGELQCSAGEFGEAIDHLEAAAGAWFEDGRYDLWALATRNLALAHCTLGDLQRAQELLLACERRAVSVSATEAMRDILEVQMSVSAELDDVKGAEDVYMQLGGGQVVESNRVNESMSAFAHIAIALAEGTSEEAEDWYEKLKKPLRNLPKYTREWTWCSPLYWATFACHQLVRMSKQSRDVVLTQKVVSSMAQVTKKLRELAERHKGVVPTSAFCDGLMDVAAGRTGKACDDKIGGFHKAIISSLETGSVRALASGEAQRTCCSYSPSRPLTHISHSPRYSSRRGRRLSWLGCPTTPCPSRSALRSRLLKSSKAVNRTCTSDASENTRCEQRCCCSTLFAPAPPPLLFHSPSFARTQIQRHCLVSSAPRSA